MHDDALGLQVVHTQAGGHRLINLYDGHTRGGINM